MPSPKVDISRLIEGQSSITNFLVKEPVAGRPKRKRRKGSGNKKKTQKITAANTADVVITAAAAILAKTDALPKQRRGRVTCKEGSQEAKDMQQVIQDWKEHTGNWEHGLSMNKYCERCNESYGIKRSTLMPYLRKDNPLIFEPGMLGGRPSLLDAEETEVLVQVAQRMDRANHGAYQRDMITKMQVLQPHLTVKQCTNSFSRTVHPNATKKGALKKGTKVAQRTSSARSMITIDQQWRWHFLIDTVDKRHLGINASDGSGVRFSAVQVCVCTCSCRCMV